MAQAAKELDLPFTTFKRIAIEFDCYKTNQSGKGLNKKNNGNKINLSEILNGEYPQYQANKLRVRLIKEGIKEHKCERCTLNEWLGKPIPLELHHKDGDKYNNKLKNLQILCPNCHSQTDNYCGKNIGKIKMAE